MKKCLRFQLKRITIETYEQTNPQDNDITTVKIVSILGQANINVNVPIRDNYCWWFVPSFKVTDPNDKKLYMIHPPTCCFGGCVNCCPGGSCPCPHGCCMIPCDVYAVDKNGFEIQEKV